MVKRALVFLFLMCFCLMAGIEYAQTDEPLTQEEIQWVKENYPVIRFVPDLFYAPIEYLEGENIVGLSMDYINWINSQYGLNFEAIKTENWEEGLVLVKQDQAHMHSAVGVTPERLTYLHFTEPFVVAPRVLLRRKDQPSIDDENALLSLKVGVVSGYAVEAFMQMRYPTVTLEGFETIEKALLALSFGEIDALATELYQATYYSEQLKITNLSANNRYAIDYPIQLSFAFNENHERLALIFDKILATIPESEIKAWESKRFSAFNEAVFPVKLLLGIGVFITGLGMCTVIVLFWNRSLKRKVLEKTESLHAVNSELYERNIELNEQYMEIQALYEEMAATEETLRENYEELSLYKNQLEYRAFHRLETDLYNRAFLEKTLQGYKEGENQDILLSIRYSDETLGHLFYHVKALIHRQLAFSLKALSGKLNGIQVFDVTEGEICLLLQWHDDVYKDLKQLITAIASLGKSIKINDTLTLSVKVLCGGVKGLDAHSRIYSQVALAHATPLSGSEEISWFAPWMHETLLRRQQLASDLPFAGETKAFKVHYQPQFDGERRLIGAEALIRWEHPIYGMVSPTEFIELAEQLSLIGVVGEFVLTEVAQFQYRLQKTHGLFIPIAINVSILELLDRTYLDKVAQILDAVDVDATYFAFEITETAFSTHVDAISESIQGLIQRGHRVHLDDFGTGYASFGYLNQFVIHSVKIDRLFVQSHDERGHLLPSMLLFFRKINLPVVAEGIETREQFELLLAMGCTQFQGFLFSKPIPEEAFVKGFSG